MLDSSARRRGPTALMAGPGLLVLVVLVVLAALLAGCSGEEEQPPAAEPTPIARLNTAAMEVPRIEFCPLVGDAAISRALDGKPDADASYGNGDEVRLPGVGTEVVHELGCSWTRGDTSTARAWIFARPMTAAQARAVIASGARTKGCRVVDGPAYGKPAMTQVCRLAGGEQRVRHAGLFDQTWLTCELTATSAAPAADLRSRTDHWCVEVLDALNTAR